MTLAGTETIGIATIKKGATAGWPAGLNASGGSDPSQALLQVLVDATAALAHLDAESLELLQMRALQVDGEFVSLESCAVGENARRELASRRRIFAEVLRSTGEHVRLLKRMGGQRGRANPWDL